MHLLKTAPSSFLLAAVLGVSACGGGGGVGTTLLGLSNTANTSPVSITLVSRTGSASGTFITGTGVVTAGSTTANALVGGVNTGLNYLRVTDVGSVVVLETTGAISPSTATYNGNALVRVTDVGASTVYNGTATALMSVDFATAANSTISYTNFSGTKRIGLSSPTAHSGGTVTITGATATSAGLSGGTVPTVSGFGGTNFSGGSTNLNGLFAGPDAAEVGGVATATATGGDLQSTFVGKR